MLVSKADRTKRAAREKVAQMRAQERRRHRRRAWILGISAAVIVVAVTAVVLIVVLPGGGPTAAAGGPAARKLAPLTTLGTLRPAGPAGPAGAEGVPVPAAAPLAGLATAVTGQPADGISCQTSEQTIFHIHAHLAIFVNGAARQVPAAIGIPVPQVQQSATGSFIGGGSCFYWLHTHAADGIIHIESPAQRTYTLGNFFDEWGQPLGPDRVGPATGPVVAIYDGSRYEGNPRDIPLTAHAQIQLEVGKPLIAPVQITFPGGL